MFNGQSFLLVEQLQDKHAAPLLFLNWMMARHIEVYIFDTLQKLANRSSSDPAITRIEVAYLLTTMLAIITEIEQTKESPQVCDEHNP